MSKSRTAREIVEILRTRRQKYKIHQWRIADELGVKREQVCLWEKGGREPRFDTLCRWANLLGFTVDLRDRDAPTFHSADGKSIAQRR